MPAKFLGVFFFWFCFFKALALKRQRAGLWRHLRCFLFFVCVLCGDGIMEWNLWRKALMKVIFFFDLKQSEGWWTQNPAAGTVKTTVNDGIFAYQLVSQQQELPNLTMTREISHSMRRGFLRPFYSYKFPATLGTEVATSHAPCWLSERSATSNFCWCRKALRRLENHNETMQMPRDVQTQKEFWTSLQVMPSYWYQRVAAEICGFTGNPCFSYVKIIEDPRRKRLFVEPLGWYSWLLG